MNELTLELFGAVSGAAELDEAGRQRVFGWLSMLLKMPYLDEAEKKNALILLDHLETLRGGEVFAPMYKTARAKLGFEVPEPWNMEWPENYQVLVNGENLSLSDLRRRGVEHVDFRLNKPIRNSLEYSYTRRLHSDGRVEPLYEYRVFSAPPVGERHVFNTYGEKAVI